MGWYVKWEVFPSSILCFHFLISARLRVKVAFWKRLSGDTPDFLSGLNLLSVHPVGSTLYRFQFWPEELTETNLESGLIKRAQELVRFRLRSKSFMIQSKGLFKFHRLEPDNQWALV